MKLLLCNPGPLLAAATLFFLSGNASSGNLLATSSGGSVALDERFAPVVLNTREGEIRRIFRLPEGKMLISGSFDGVSDRHWRWLGLLNPDGTTNAAFAPPEGTYIIPLAVLPDGRTLVTRDASGEPGYEVRIMDMRGTLDGAFRVVASSEVHGATVLSDGSYLLFGSFSAIAGGTRPRLARILPDGTLDTAFQPPVSSMDSIMSVALQPGGGVLVHGSIQSPEFRNIIRLLPDGSSDPSFQVSLSGITTMEVASDGRIYIGSNNVLWDAGGTMIGRVARLHRDGALEQVYNFSGSSSTDNHRLIKLLRDGRLLLWESQHLRIAHPDTGLDTGFSARYEPHSGRVYDGELDDGGNLIAVGTFTGFNGTDQANITLLHSDGRVDMSYGPKVGRTGWVQRAAFHPGGKIVISGWFDAVNGVRSIYLARLNHDGTIDPTFSSRLGPTSILALAVQSDGKTIVGGMVSFNNDRALRRLNVDGSIDLSFVPFPTTVVSHLRVLPDDSLLVPSGQGITRLLRDGLIDPDFHRDESIRSAGHFDVDAQGRLIVPVNLTLPDGTLDRGRIVRLYPDGRIDPAFDSRRAGAFDGAYRVAAAPDGTVLVAGTFTWPSAPRNKVARLRADGSLDESFDLDIGPSDTNPFGIAIRTDGKFFVGPPRGQKLGAIGGALALAFPDGSPDLSFGPYFTGHYLIHSLNLAMDPNGSALLLGINGVNGAVRNGAARFSAADFSLQIEQPYYSAAAGGQLEVAVQVSGEHAFTYQWYRDGVLLEGATSRTLRFDALSSGDQGGYSVAVTGAGRTLTAGPVRVDIAAPPAILVQPVDRSELKGSDASLTVVATGASTYQWYKDGIPILGAVTPRLALESVHPDDEGEYQALVSNATGSIWSRTARLEVRGMRVDEGFAPVFADFQYTVDAAVVQPDGKLIVAGRFSVAGDRIRPRLARLNTDGSVDETFDGRLGLNSEGGTSPVIRALLLQPDGKVLVGGTEAFRYGATQVSSSLVRVNPDGTLDQGFRAQVKGTIWALARHSDGSVWIAGDISSVNGESRSRLARISADGDLDPAGPGAAQRVYHVAVQPDGSAIVAGDFTWIGGIERHRIARIRPNGTVDTSFDAAGRFSTIQAVLPAAGGKVYVGGRLASSGGPSQYAVVRLNSDGSVDSSFSPVNLTSQGAVFLAAMPENALLVAGAVAQLRPAFKVVTSDGQTELVLSEPSAVSSSATALAVDPGKAIYLARTISSIDPPDRRSLSRYDFAGKIDSRFDAMLAAAGQIETYAVYPDGRILVIGRFSRVNDVPVTGDRIRSDQLSIARLLPNGGTDISFPPRLLPPDIWNGPRIEIEANGDLLLWGSFTSVAGKPIRHVARLRANGEWDDSFAPNPDGAVSSLTTDPEGRILLGGSFNAVGGESRPFLARLLPDGRPDPGFAAHVVNGIVRSILPAADPGGEILIAGSFTRLSGHDRHRIGRLLQDGTVDPTFAADPAFTEVSNLHRLSDGRPVALVRRGTWIGTFVAFRQDGSLDPAWSEISVDTLNDAAADTSGNLLLSTTASLRHHIARYKPSGEMDEAFHVAVPARSLAVQGPGEVLVGRSENNFLEFAAERLPRTSLARLTSRRFAVHPLPAQFLVPSGGSALLSAKVTGGGPLSFQWERNGVAISGQNAPEIVISASDAGAGSQYRLRVTAGGASMLSDPVMAIARDIPVIGGMLEIEARTNEPFTYTIQAAPAPTTFKATSLPPGLVLDSANGIISGTPVVPGVYALTLTAENAFGAGSATITLRVFGRPSILVQPQNSSALHGSSVHLSVSANGYPAPVYQWHRNGVPISGATSDAFRIEGLQSEHTGGYSVVVSNTEGGVTSNTAIVALSTDQKFAGSGYSPPSYRNIVHPNGNLFDQVLLTGTSATITADPGKVTRISFIDLNDDIVQVEFSGPGSLTVTLDSASGPALPLKYDQDIAYMKGHPSLVLTGPTKETHLSIFSVGRANAVNQAIFREDETYDGWANVASLAVLPGAGDGSMAALRLANTHFFAVHGTTGIEAPQIRILGPAYIGDLTAAADARSALRFSALPELWITGGDLYQENGRSILIQGITRIRMRAGSSSHGELIGPLESRGTLERDGIDVTSSLIQP